jgi:hypothetical protein
MDSLGEDDLQELFDATAQVPSEEQLERLLAHAGSAPTRGRGLAKQERAGRFWIPLAAAAAFTVAVGGAVWVSDPDPVVRTATTATVKTAVPANPEVVVPAPTAVASSDSSDDPDDPFYPDDPLAVLEADGDDSGDWMSELDLLHDPADTDEAASWDAMDQLLDDDG